MALLKSTGPVEPKTSAGRTGGGLGGASALMLVWLLSETLFDGNPIPWPVEGFVYAAITVGLPAAGAYAMAWRAPHLHRRDPDAVRTGVGPGEHRAGAVQADDQADVPPLPGRKSAFGVDPDGTPRDGTER